MRPGAGPDAYAYAGRPQPPLSAQALELHRPSVGAVAVQTAWFDEPRLSRVELRQRLLQRLGKWPHYRADLTGRVSRRAGPEALDRVCQLAQERAPVVHGSFHDGQARR